MSPVEIERRVHELGDWFQNLDLCGVRTAPNHFLGDYPNFKWRSFEHAIPSDLSGKTVLDIGCNAGFYSLEMKRRGAARVVGIDSDEQYLAQARFAAEVNGADIEFRELDIYDVAKLRERFDLVLFMGVLYHLRHPLLALDLLYEHVVKDTPRLPVAHARQPRNRAARKGLPVLGNGDLRQARLPADVFRRAPLFARPDELVDPKQRLRRSHAAQRRLRDRRSSRR